MENLFRKYKQDSVGLARKRTLRRVMSLENMQLKINSLSSGMKYQTSVPSKLSEAGVCSLYRIKILGV
jgi:hypothetical protein